MAKIKKFDIIWPDGMGEFNINLWAWKHYEAAKRLGGVLPDRTQLVLDAVDMTFPKDVVSIDPWFEKYCHIWSDNRFATVMGPASCGKSNTFGLLALLWWIVDP